MQNSLNQTQTTPNTGNPQNVGGTESVNEGSDFQQTAPQDLLSQQQRALAVEETGDPLPAANTPPAGGSSMLIWLILAGLLVAVGVGIWAAKFFDEDEEVSSPAPQLAKTKMAPATKNKITKTKSGKPVKKSKKPARKRR